MYACQYLFRRAYFEAHNPQLRPFFEAFHYLVDLFFSATRHSLALRDEDVCFPPHSQPFHTLELKDILSGLGSGDPHFRFMRALLLITVNAFDSESLAPSHEDAQAAKKKNKKAKAKSQAPQEKPDMAHALQELASALDALEARGSTDSEWARSLFDDRVTSALPLTSAKKKYARLTFPESIKFFREMHAQLAALRDVQAVLYIEELHAQLQRFML